MTNAPNATSQAVANLAGLAANLALDATHNVDPQRRLASAQWLGLMKYDAERAIRHAAPRSPANEILYQFAVAQLPIVDAFIHAADADQLRNLITGMLEGLNNDYGHPDE